MFSLIINNYTSCIPRTENILQRVISILKLLWAFVLHLLDDLTDGLNSFCKDNLDISKVLRFERALLNQQQKKVREIILHSHIKSLHLGATVFKCYLSEHQTLMLSAHIFLDFVHENICHLFLVCQGKEVSQESVKQFYENWMSRQNTLSSQEDLAESLAPPPTPPAEPSSRHAYARLRSHASKISWGSSVSRWALFFFFFFAFSSDLH